MNNNDAQNVINILKHEWQLDDDAFLSTENGFDWWPGSHKVSVRCFPKKTDDDALIITIQTDLLRNFDAGDSTKQALALELGRFCAGYAWLFTPFEVSQQFDRDSITELSFFSSFVIRPSTLSWLPLFIARLAIIQPIDAERLSHVSAESLSAEQAISGIDSKNVRNDIDDMLGVAGSIYIPAGQNPSNWRNCDEFEEFAEEYAKSDRCFGMGDKSRLTLETPFGKDSMLIKLLSETKHPELGSGLLATLELPVINNYHETAGLCAYLNFYSAMSYFDGPFLGSWHPRKINDKDALPSYATFIPNMLYKEGMATNLAFWNLTLARWVKETFWPELTDLTMEEILKSRFG